MTPPVKATPPRTNATASDLDEPASHIVSNHTAEGFSPQCTGARFGDDAGRAKAILGDPKEAQAPSQKQLEWLMHRGIAATSLSTPLAISVTRAVFDGRGRYYPSQLGRSVILFAVIDAGVVDVAAWDPKSSEIATRLGVGASLGQGQIGRDGLGTHGPALPVWRNPIGWLKAGRVGVVIIDRQLSVYRLAGHILWVGDEAHAAELRRFLQVDPPTVIVSPEKQG